MGDFPDDLQETRVDLGEDLLESRSEAQAGVSIPHETNSLLDTLQRAKILFDEGLLEDSKRLLWKIQRQEQVPAECSELLKKIEAAEIQQLLSGDPDPRRFGVSSLDEPKISPLQTLNSLEKDLRISADGDDRKQLALLFSGEEQYSVYRDRIARMAAALPDKDRLDLAVAYVELGLPDLAADILRPCLSIDSQKLPASYLLAVALISADKAIEATILLEPIVRDLKLSESVKTDFLYLMATAFERLGDAAKSKDFYRRVFQLNPNYRSTKEKLRALG
jgi:tetratricopeptide (TPR) repeat protein